MGGKGSELNFMRDAYQKERFFVFNKVNVKISEKYKLNIIKQRSQTRYSFGEKIVKCITILVHVWICNVILPHTAMK